VCHDIPLVGACGGQPRSGALLSGKRFDRRCGERRSEVLHGGVLLRPILRVCRGIDARLKELNDDYEVERKHALKDVVVTVLPEETFMEFMKRKGKIGGQHKFPRVLKGKMLEEWQRFLMAPAYS